jgi:hypothetical protein
MRYCHSTSSANSAWTRPFLLIVALCVFASWPASAQTSDSVTLAGHVPTKVQNGSATLVGHYNPNQMLRLALAVQAPHMAEEEEFIKELVTKGSPNFHQFLTPDEWNARFAPAAEDEQAVVDWAKSEGLTVTRRYPNRLAVDVEAPAGVIEKAFGVTINNYQVGDEVDFSNDLNPAIPASLSGILHTVLGLNNIERVHRIGSAKATVKGADYVPGPAYAEGFSGQGGGKPVEGGSVSSSKTNDSFPLDDKSGTYAADPDNIQSSEAYDYNALQQLSHCCNVHNDTTGSPAVSSIALVGYGAYNYSDVTTFFGAYINQAADGSGPCYMEWNLSNILVDGSAPAVDGEAPLDVEYAGAMSNSCGFSNSGKQVNTAHIYEYEMADSSYATYYDAFSDIVSDDYAKVVSTSYGFVENVGFSGSYATGTMHPLFNSMLGSGWTLIAASGDNGASDGCGDATAVDYPSSDPDFLAAGGTQLTLNDSGIYVSEIGWQGEFWTNDGGACANNHGGSTGGVSVLFGAPYWQSQTSSSYPTGVESPYYDWVGTTEYKVTGNTNRVVPDISLTANPDVMGEWYYSGGSWQDEGGTSIVAPELAGFFAQFNTYLNYIGPICGSGGTTPCTPAGLASPFIYDAGLIGAAHDPFYDMLSGCNDNNVTANYGLAYYCAGPGFDLVTGWGSANMLQLAWAINYNLIPAYGEPVITYSGPTTNTWYNTDQEVSWTVTTVNTRSGGTTPPPGVAGFTQGWDSIPSDPYSEPGGGEGNSFYSGPEYAFGTTGCLSFNGGFGCQGGSGQGCHTAKVEAWDNQGDPLTQTYGPICYDTVAPTITASTNPATSYTVWVNKSVVVTLTATDPGGAGASGIKTTYYAINSGSCYPGSVSTCSVYTAPFTISAQGQSYVYYFTEDKAGNFSSEPYIWVSIDKTPPVTTATLSGTLNGPYYQNQVGVTLTATDNLSGVASTVYQVDGGSWITYSGAFTVVTNGADTVNFYSTDKAGNVGATQTVAFGITDKTTTGLTSSWNPPGTGKVVTFTATVTPAVSGTPTGSVTFKDGGTVLVTKALSGGKATYATAALAIGIHSITATFGGSTYFLASASSALSQEVGFDSTTVVTSSANPSSFGEPVKLTATITHTATPIPTGTVTFKAGATVLGAVAVNSSGAAVYATSTLTVATHTITAVYSGDSNYGGSTSAALSQVVDKAATATTVLSSVNPSHFGQTVKFTATVKAVAPGTGTPTGTVNFKNGATVLGSIALSAGEAAFSTAALAAGTHSITVVYVASTDYATSTSAVLSQVVDEAATATTVVSSVNPSHFGQTVKFTATVKAVAPGTGTPTGTVNFKNGATVLGSATLSGGVAAFSTAALAAGTHSITVVYVASTDYATSTSAVLSQVVDKASTKTTIASSLNPSTSGTTVTFTATVTAVAPGVGTPAGTVTFKNGTTTLGTGTLSAGKATFATSTLAEGTDSITAVYGGNLDFTTSTSGVVSQKVNP